MWEKRVMGLMLLKTLDFVVRLARRGLQHKHISFHREPASGSRFIPEKGTVRAPCSTRRGQVCACTMAPAPMKLFRKGDLSGVPGEEGLIGWLALRRNSLRPRVILSPPREDFSLLLAVPGWGHHGPSSQPRDSKSTESWLNDSLLL